MKIMFKLSLSILAGLALTALPSLSHAANVKEALEKQQPTLDRSSTLLGTDNNHNGVRDDLDAYIDNLPDTSSQKMALRQNARALNHALEAGSKDVDQNTLKAVDREIARAVNCLHRQYDSGVATKKSAMIEKITANTRARFNAYDQLNAKMSGTTGRLPSGDTCDK